MPGPPVEDVIELEQLLARYAVGMTKDDVEAVMEVFTTDGTYSAFGDVYALSDFPTLVAAAPKGLFMVGTPALVLDGDTGTGEQPLCFIDQTEPRHAHRLVHRHLPAHRQGLAAPDAPDDLPPQERLPRLGSGPRPHPAPAHQQLTGPPTAWSSSSSGPRSTRGWTPTPTRSPPPTSGKGTLGRADGPDRQGQAAHVRRRLHALGLARAGRRPRRIDVVAGVPAGGGDRPRPGRAGPVLHAGGPGPDDDRLRPAGAGRHHGAPPAPGRRDLVPGLLRAGHRLEPRVAVVPVRPRRRHVAGHRARRCGRAWPSSPSGACCSPVPGTTESAHRGITALFVDMDTPGITVRPIETMHGSPEFSEVFFDDVVVPVDRMLGGEGQGWSVAMDLLPYERSTALWQRAAFLHRRLQQLLEVAPAGKPRSAAAGRGHPDPVRLPGPLPGHPAPHGRGRPARRRDLDRQGAARHHRTGGLRPGRRRPHRRGRHRRRPGQPSTGAASTCTPGRRPSTAAAPRSSATSSPAASSTSGTTADGQRRPGTCSSGACATPPRAAPAPSSTPRSSSSAGPTPWRPTGGPRSRCCSPSRAGPPPPPVPSTTCS